MPSSVYLPCQNNAFSGLCSAKLNPATIKPRATLTIEITPILYAGGYFYGGRYRIRTYHLHNVNVAL